MIQMLAKFTTGTNNWVNYTSNSQVSICTCRWELNWVLLLFLGLCRLMTRFMSNQRKYTLDSVLSQLSCPLLLVWGDLDPWVGPAKALRIKEFYPNTSIVNLQAGHCPHDEVPELVNKALLEWLSSTASLQAPWTSPFLHALDCCKPVSMHVMGH